MAFVEGTTISGWGVVRVAPATWHFVGIYQSKADADLKAAELGPDYVVRFGQGHDGTDDFVWTSADNPGC